MGKRSSFPRRQNDEYATPLSAVLPLLPHLNARARYYEPCVGRGDLVGHLDKHGLRLVGASDLEKDARVTQYFFADFECFITNPPWTREILHPIINNLRIQAPTWLLFDADWMHTRQAAPYLRCCSKIVSVGRVKWIPDSPFVGKDNACWYLFENRETHTNFIGRDVQD